MTEVLSATHKRNQVVTDDEQQLTSTYSDSAVNSLYNNFNNNTRSNNNNNYTKAMQDLDLAQGLIELLIENNFTTETLRNTSSSELSKILGIDQEVAGIICAAANKKKKTIRSGKLADNRLLQK